MGYTKTTYRPPGMLHRNLDESEDPSTWIQPVTTHHDETGKQIPDPPDSLKKEKANNDTK